MADSPAHSESGAETGATRDPGSTAATPRWVKVFAAVVLVLVLVAVVLILTGRAGEHGPGRHVPAADTSGGHTPPAGGEHGEEEP